MDTETIHAIVTDIRTSQVQGDKKVYFQGKYPRFVDDYPKLFQAALNPQFPLQFLDMMLQQLNMLDSKKTTLEQADEIVYGELRSVYVEPTIKELEERGKSTTVNLINTSS